MKSCEEFSKQITDYLDGRLPFGERLGFWIHSLMCDHCRRYYEQIEEVVETMGALPEEENIDADEAQKQRVQEAFEKRFGEGDVDRDKSELNQKGESNE